MHLLLQTCNTHRQRGYQAINGSYNNRVIVLIDAAWPELRQHLSITVLKAQEAGTRQAAELSTDTGFQGLCFCLTIVSNKLAHSKAPKTCSGMCNALRARCCDNHCTHPTTVHQRARGAGFCKVVSGITLQCSAGAVMSRYQYCGHSITLHPTHASLDYQTVTL